MMPEETDELSAQLSALADEPAPPSGIDVAGARTRGRARVRQRQLAVAGAAAAVLVLAGSLALHPAGDAQHVAAPPVTVSATPSPSPSASHTPRANADPLTTEVRFGWLPDWADASTGVGYETGYHGIFAQARGRGADAPRIYLSLYPAGPEPEPGKLSGLPLHRVEAPAVDGRTAYWLVTDRDNEAGSNGAGHGEFTLRWLTASGRWAQLHAYPLTDANAEETLLRVAADVRYGTVDVPLPVQFTGLPDTFTATDVALSRPDVDGKGAWSLWIQFAVEGKAVSVTANPVRTAAPDPAQTETDGSQYVDPNPPLCTADDGVQVCVSAPQGSAPAVDRLGGLPGLLSRIKVLGVTDGAWTTEVLA